MYRADFGPPCARDCILYIVHPTARTAIYNTVGPIVITGVGVVAIKHITVSDSIINETDTGTRTTLQQCPIVAVAAAVVGIAVVKRPTPDQPRRGITDKPQHQKNRN